MSELKPCPFCGGEASYYEGSTCFVECKECGLKGNYTMDESSSCEFWNTRALLRDLSSRDPESVNEFLQAIEKLPDPECEDIPREQPGEVSELVKPFRTIPELVEALRNINGSMDDRDFNKDLSAHIISDTIDTIQQQQAEIERLLFENIRLMNLEKDTFDNWKEGAQRRTLEITQLQTRVTELEGVLKNAGSALDHVIQADANHTLDAMNGNLIYGAGEKVQKTLALAKPRDANGDSAESGAEGVGGSDQKLVDKAWEDFCTSADTTPCHSQSDKSDQQGDLRVMGEWQPIETAPKDGSDFIIAYNDGDVRVGHYLDNSKSQFPYAGFRPQYGVEKAGKKIVKWMPLPPKPEDV